MEIFARRKYSPISPPALIGENFITLIFCPLLMISIEDMATFTALAKIYSSKFFCNTKVAGLGEIFVQRKFPHIRQSEELNQPMGKQQQFYLGQKILRGKWSTLVAQEGGTRVWEVDVPTPARSVESSTNIIISIQNIGLQALEIFTSVFV